MALLQAETRIISAGVHDNVEEESIYDRSLSQNFKCVSQAFGRIVASNS
jgi:hypothetical protein